MNNVGYDMNGNLVDVNSSNSKNHIYGVTGIDQTDYGVPSISEPSSLIWDSSKDSLSRPGGVSYLNFKEQSRYMLLNSSTESIEAFYGGMEMISAAPIASVGTIALVSAGEAAAGAAYIASPYAVSQGAEAIAGFAEGIMTPAEPSSFVIIPRGLPGSTYTIFKAGTTGAILLYNSYLSE